MKHLFLLIPVLFFLNHLNAQWVDQNSNLDSDLDYCFFTSADTGYAFCYNANYTKTTDGGTTWTPHNIPFLQELVNSIYFTDGQTGYTCNENGWIYKTENGGDTWGYQESGTHKYLFSIFFPTKNTGYIVGDSGVILKTTNGGTVWTHQNSGTLFPLKSVYFVNADTGYAAGGAYSWPVYGSVFLKTTNGGETWTSLPTGGQYPFSKIFFVSADTGFAIADSGSFGSSRILKTTNGGNTWSIINMAVYNNFTSIFFVNAEIGYATDRGPSILKTTTGGNDWVRQYVDHSFYTVYFLDADTGYAVGFQFNSGPIGAIIKTTNGGGTFVDAGDLQSSLEGMKIFPNPAEDKIMLKTTSNPCSRTLSILTPQGRELLNKAIAEPLSEIDISTLPPGIYIAVLRGEKSVQTGKIIKK